MSKKPRTQAPAIDLLALRKSLGLNQADMAKRMGLGSRAYFGLEVDPRTIRPRHIMLAERASLDVAIEKKDPMLAAATLRQKMIDWAALLRK